MNDLETRLKRCFSAVFPDLPDGRIMDASLDTVSEWDSVAQITLMQVIEDEFQVKIDEEDAEQLTSFQAWREHLR